VLWHNGIDSQVSCSNGAYDVFVQSMESISETQVKRKLLVIDDQRAILETLEAMLTGAGYRVSCVPSGAAALSAARLTCFDAVLIDINMPMMDGFETALRLRAQCEQRGQTIRMWHMTGVGGPAIEHRSAQSGVMGLLLKPFRMADLCRVLEEGFTAPVPPMDPDFLAIISSEAVDERARTAEDNR
jgi:CheY-like chemotaxis protein